uniref:Putative ovule protein n=1 Tax=Solanum chacoense TaxID=4108 RepID=A0A0V0H6R4_SOLCH
MGYTRCFITGTRLMQSFQFKLCDADAAPVIVIIGATFFWQAVQFRLAKGFRGSCIFIKTTAYQCSPTSGSGVVVSGVYEILLLPCESREAREAVSNRPLAQVKDIIIKYLKEIQ